jgi:hypothetical protein
MNSNVFGEERRLLRQTEPAHPAKMSSKRRKIAHEPGAEKKAPQAPSIPKGMPAPESVQSPPSSEPETATLDNASRQENDDEKMVAKTFKDLVRSLTAEIESGYS